MGSQHKAIFAVAPHPHPAAQNDTQRVIEIESELAVVIVHAQDGNGFTAERIAKNIALSCNSRDDLLEAAQEAIRFIEWIRNCGKEGVEIYKHELLSNADLFESRIAPAITKATGAQ